MGAFSLVSGTCGGGLSIKHCRGISDKRDGVLGEFEKKIKKVLTRVVVAIRFAH